MTYKHHDEGEQYRVVNYTDVEDLLSFSKNEYKNLEEQIKEEKRVEGELKRFIRAVEKHSDHKIHFIGHEKRFGIHLIRFLFKKGGLLEVIVDKPLAINGHFVDRKHAKAFAKGLKRALDKELPENQVKSMMVDNVTVEDGFKDAILTVDKWSRIHRIAVHKTVIITVFAFIILLINEAMRIIVEETALHLFHLESIFIAIVVATFFAVLLDPLKSKTEALTMKYFNKKG